MTRAARAGAVLAVAVLLGSVAHAYLKIGFEFQGRVRDLRWTTLPVRYYVTNRDVAGVSAPQLAGIARNSFAAWAKVPGVTLSSQFVGVTTATPFVDDGMTVIGFEPRPDLERTLGATTFVIDDVSGELVEADIFLNSTFDWSSASGGEAGRFDVQSILTHEIGHLLGLSHSALGETELRPSSSRRVLGAQTIMFPIAFPAGSIEDRTTKADDEAGLRDLYSPTSGDYGQIAGRVTLQGKGIFGAHVTAMNTKTADLVAGFSLTDNGDFVIAGLTPGIYILRAEPLDDADVDSFFDEGAVVNVDFKPTYSSTLVNVRGGGAGPSVEIKVVPK